MNQTHKRALFESLMEYKHSCLRTSILLINKSRDQVTVGDPFRMKNLWKDSTLLFQVCLFPFLGYRLPYHFTMAISEPPGKMYALAGALSVLATVAVILRFYSRRFLKTTKIAIDDYMILPALVCYIPSPLMRAGG